MKIQQFNRSTCGELRLAVQRALNDAGIEGVEFRVGNMSFSETECSIKVSAKTAGNAAERSEVVERVARQSGIASTRNEAGWSLVDYHPKKHMYPFIATDAGGKRFKLTLEEAKRRFGAAA